MVFGVFFKLKLDDKFFRKAKKFIKIDFFGIKTI
jgi:hypothetical protein